MKRAYPVVAVMLLSSVVQAQAFRRTQTNIDSGECLYWPSRTFTYFVDAAGDDEIAGDAEFAAIDKAFAAWQASSNACSDVKFVNGGRVDHAKIEYSATGPNQNVIVFRAKKCTDFVAASDACWLSNSCGNAYSCWAHAAGSFAVPTLTFLERTGELLDADLELNLASFVFTTVDSPVCVAPNYAQSCVATDVQNAVTPAIGRWLGLASVSRADSTLYPASSPGDLTKRVIDPGTASGLCAIYPAGQLATTCDGGFVTPRALIDAGVDGGALGSGDAGTVSADGGSGASSPVPVPCACSSSGLGSLGALFAAMCVLRRLTVRRLQH